MCHDPPFGIASEDFSEFPLFSLTCFLEEDTVVHCCPGIRFPTFFEMTMFRTIHPPFCRFALSILALLLTLSAPVPAGENSSSVTMIAGPPEAAKYWPGWRGPTRQGIATDGDYVDKWSPTENVLWKIVVPGEGNSSPVVWADRIFLTTAHEKGKRRAILCLDRASGKQLWETFTPAGVVENTKDKNGFASGTPATDGERVYAYFGNFGLLCVDFTGQQVWHQEFGPLDAYHGTSCSPLLYKNSVIVFQDHRTKGGSFIAAFDKATGKELWKTPRKETVGWGSPIAIRAGDQDQIIVSSQNTVYAYHPDTGKVLWTCGGNLFEVTPTPVVGHDMVFCCSGRAGPTLAIHPTGTGEVSTTHLEWKTIKGSPFIPSPILYGDYLYTINDIVSVITCFEAATGTVIWQERLGEPTKHGFSASPVAVNGKIFFTNDAGETYVVKAGPKFEMLHVNRMNERTLASPALVDGLWYIRTEGHLYCVGKKN
jgi:outer membrane protein assembly factor BamB